MERLYDEKISQNIVLYEHSANLQPAAYVANTKFLSVFSWEAA